MLGYTTKPNPGLGNVLEMLRQGVERLEAERAERERDRDAKAERCALASLHAQEHLVQRDIQDVGSPELVFSQMLLEECLRLDLSAASAAFNIRSHCVWKLYTKN